MNPDLDKEMSFWVKLLGLDKPDPISGKPWKVTWGWVDSIDLGNGQQAYGLNTVNGDTQESRIDIRKLYTDKDRAEFVDTCAHEAAHCLGARMEALLIGGKQNEAHEYIAERLAPAFVALRGSPRAKALAKSIRQWPKRAMALAKAATLPARAKGTKMDPKQVAAALALIAAASTPEEKEKLLAEYQSQVNAMTGDNDAGPSSGVPGSDAAPGLPAAPAEDTNKPPMQAPAAAPLEPGYAKAFEVLVDAREDLKPRRNDVLGYLKKHHKTIEGAAEYLKTIPVPKPMATPAAPAAKPLDTAPRGGNQSATHRLGKTDNQSLSDVAKALGQPTEKKTGPTILAKGKGENAPRFFTLGNLTPTEYREKRASGWDPRKEFPRASEVMQ